MVKAQQKKLIEVMKITTDPSTLKTLSEEMEKMQKDIDDLNNRIEQISVGITDTIYYRIFGKRFWWTIPEGQRLGKDKREPIVEMDYRSLSVDKKKAVIDLLVDKIYLNADGSAVVVFKQSDEFTAEFNEEQRQKVYEITSKMKK